MVWLTVIIIPLVKAQPERICLSETIGQAYSLVGKVDAMKGKLWLWLVLLVIMSGISLFLGVRDISWSNLTADDRMVLMTTRWPRLMSLWMCGAGLAVAGLLLQQLSRNKFAAPSTTGTIESAGLGLLVSMIWFPSAPLLVKVSIAFVFSLGGSFIFILFLERVVYKDAMIIPLVGIMMGRVIAAITTFLAYQYDLMQSLSSWLYGDFSAVMKGRYELLYVGIPAVVIAYVFAHHFTVAGLGETTATGLGLSYKKIRLLGLSIVALVVASVVITVGEIAFVGLIVPNLVTWLYGDNIRKTLPYTAILGSLFVVVSDCLGRMIVYPYELSASLIIGVIGSALFLWAIRRKGDA